MIFDEVSEVQSNITYDAIIAKADLAVQMLDMSDATEDNRLRQTSREDAIKTYRSIRRILEKVTLTNEQMRAIHQKLAIVRSRLL